MKQEIENALTDIRGCFQAYYKMGNVPELDTSLKIIETELKQAERNENEIVFWQNELLKVAGQRNEFRDFCLFVCRNIKFEFDPKNLTIDVKPVDTIFEPFNFRTIIKIVTEYEINKVL